MAAVRHVRYHAQNIAQEVLVIKTNTLYVFYVFLGR